MDKLYLFEGMKMYNIQGRVIIIDNLEWINDNKGYINCYYEDSIINHETIQFAINSIGSFLFYEKKEIQWRDNINILKDIPKYSVYSKVINDYMIKNEKDRELEEFTNKINKIKKEREKDSNSNGTDNEIQEALLYETINIKNIRDTHEFKKRISKYNKLHDELESKFEFLGFIHTTDFSNFVNIMRSGYIYSRFNTNNMSLMGTDSADASVLSNTSKFVKNCVRFYFRTKTPTHYNNEGIRAMNPTHHMPIPVMLVAGRDLYENYEVILSNGNSGSKHSTITGNFETISKFDWETIFSEGSYDSDDLENNRYITRSRNAEALIENRISLSNVDKIIFRSKADLKMSRILFGDDKRYIVDPSKFFNFFQYCKDYKFEISRNNFYYNLSLNHGDEYSIRKHNHKLRLIYSSKDIVEYDLLDQGIVLNNRINEFNVSGVIKINENNHLLEVDYLIDGHINAIWRKDDVKIL